ncbi:hypothetical protein LSAT2_001590 [Lamellibrachia satsuma]|nr:hypothetical protein LSAT2_001590 [Lamellibrachia satsuma]
MAQSGECTVGTAAQSGQLDDTFLMKLSEQLGETLGSQLMQLGVYLRLDPSTVQKLRADSKDPLEIAFFLLKTWRDTRGKRTDSGAMFDELCLALSDLKKPDLTDHVRREQVRHLRDKLLKAKETTRSNRQKFNEQMKLVKDELRGTKADFESCRHKYDEDVRHLNEQVRLLKNEAQETREQMKLVTKELRGAKLEAESCRQKCDEDVRQLNEQGRLLKDEAQQTRVQGTSPKVLPSATSKKEVYGMPILCVIV